MRFKKFHKIRFMLLKDGYSRANYLKKHKLLKEIGNNVFFQPRKLPDNPDLIKLGNNVVIASDVTFICHDVMNYLFNGIEKDSTTFHFGGIEISDNVFIGANSTVLPNVKINKNVIVGASSTVTKDVPENSVVAGSPSKIIGKFDDVFQKRKSDNTFRVRPEKVAETAWNILEDR